MGVGPPNICKTFFWTPASHWTTYSTHTWLHCLFSYIYIIYKFMCYSYFSLNSKQSTQTASEFNWILLMLIELELLVIPYLFKNTSSENNSASLAVICNTISITHFERVGGSASAHQYIYINKNIYEYVHIH